MWETAGCRKKIGRPHRNLLALKRLVSKPAEKIVVKVF